MLAPLRKELFWTLDLLKGAKVKKYFEDIRRINECPYSEAAIASRERYLQNILQHCLNTVPFYRELELEGPGIEQFPVVDKNYIRERQDSFISTKYRKEKLYRASTSGSTGTPFTVLHHRSKRIRNTADTLYFAKKAGYALGEPLFFMRIWEKNGLGRLIRKLSQNVHQIDVTQLTDKKLHQLLGHLSKGASNKCMLAYASAYEVICNYLDGTQPHFRSTNVKSIISMSEALPKHCKISLKKYFSCEAFSRYSNRENGILAQQIPGFEGNFLLNMGSYHFEVLKLSTNELAEDGTVGRIVVTDLFNLSMPMVRYDTGDLGIKQKYNYNGTEYAVFSRIEGRKLDCVFNTAGEMLSSFIFPNKLRRYKNIKQFQFIQAGPKTYKFILNTNSEFSREAQLIREFSEVLGEDATVEVEYVDEIPLLSSGKRKKVLNISSSV